MKYLMLITVALLSSFYSYSGIKKISVSGKVWLEGGTLPGNDVRVFVLGGSEWKDTLMDVAVKRDGKFYLQVPDSLVYYQVIFRKAGYFWKHVQVYPELGDYSFEVTLSPSSTGFNNSSGNIKWETGNGYLHAAAHEAYYRVSDFQKNMVDILMNVSASEATRKNFKGIPLGADLLTLKKKIDSSTDARLRQIYLVEYACLDATPLKVMIKKRADSSTAKSTLTIFNGKGEQEILERTIRELPPQSGLWNMDLNGIRWVMLQLPLNDELIRYSEALITGQATPAISASALYGLAQRYKKENRGEDLVKTLDRLTANYSKTHPANKAKAEFSTYSNLAVGKMIPAFSIPSMDSPQDSISAASMLGKTYLLEFWTLWCKGCLQVLPQLTSVYKKQHRKGFEIVSVYLDKSIGFAQEYRRTKNEMPWINAYEPTGFNGKFAADFELSWIPRSILVGPDGKILAVDISPDQIAGYLK